MQAPDQPYAPPTRRGLPGWAWALIGCGLFGMLLGPIAIIAAILFPVFAQARESARQTACASNMRQLGPRIFDCQFPSGTRDTGNGERYNLSINEELIRETSFGF